MQALCEPFGCAFALFGTIAAIQSGKDICVDICVLLSYVNNVLAQGDHDHNDLHNNGACAGPVCRRSCLRSTFLRGDDGSPRLDLLLHYGSHLSLCVLPAIVLGQGVLESAYALTFVPAVFKCHVYLSSLLHRFVVQ